MRFITMILLVAMTGPAFAQETPGQAPAQAPGRMTVSGEAKVVATPDMAVLRLGAQGRGETAAEAMDSTSAAVSAILARLQELGVAENDIKTTSLNLSEERRWNREQEVEVFEGYLAENIVEVRVRDLDSLGAILGDVLDEGANRMQGLQFTLQDPREVEDEARRRAVADARAKAELYAEAAGVSLGTLVTLTDSATPIVRPMDLAEPVVMEARAAKDVPVAAGEIEIRAEVTMTYALGQ
ncbi:SIMPL domain-containing protein [Sagittula stellata]|nr:SIMPL domain-containing protein [Sagittula stellata]